MQSFTRGWVKFEIKRNKWVDQCYQIHTFKLAWPRLGCFWPFQTCYDCKFHQNSWKTLFVSMFKTVHLLGSLELLFLAWSYPNVIFWFSWISFFFDLVYSMLLQGPRHFHVVSNSNFHRPDIMYESALNLYKNLLCTVHVSILRRPQNLKKFPS